MPSIFDRVLAAISGLPERVSQLEVQMAEKVSQEQADAQFQIITEALSGIAQDIADLKAAQPVGSVMSQENFDKLSTIAARAKALDAENPTPAA